MEFYYGQIMLFSGTYAPRDWAFCEGQFLQISQNQALFAVIGTTYGGDGRVDFALPDLRSRVPVGAGQGPGLTYVQLGWRIGHEQVVLNANNLPAHRHEVKCTSSVGNQSSPVNGIPGAEAVPNVDVWSSEAPGQNTMNGKMIGNTGGSTGVDIRNPTLGLHYIICTNGLFPPRND